MVSSAEPTRSRGARRRPRWPAGLLLCTLAVAAGCSSGPAAGPPKHRGHRATTTTHQTTTTAAPATTTAVTAPPVQSSSVQVQIAGATAIISFSSADLSGTLQTGNARFSASGTTFAFSVSGVTYSGQPLTTSAPSGTGLISQVVVSAAGGGVAVSVSLRSPASHDQFGLGHDTVGVTLS